MKANTTVLISIFSALFMATSVRGQLPYDADSVMKCKMPGVVAYTFDDGPAEYNDQLLAILARKNVKVSFFVLGQRLKEFPQQAKKIYDAGHVLASHTYSHNSLDETLKLNPSNGRQLIEKEMKDTSDLLFAQVGVRPNYMRPPKGECGNSICRQTMAELNYVVTHWNVDTNDWRYANKPNPAMGAMEEITDKIINKSDPTKDSFILLQHELLPWSVNTLTERLIDEVSKKGYRFVTIDECLGTPAYVGGTAPPPTTNPVPPTTNPTTPAPGTGNPAPGTGNPAPGTGNPAPGTGNPAPGTGNPAPGTGNTAPGTPSGNTPVPSGASTGPEPEKTQSAASIQQIGTWAMGAAALASYLLL
ncbi:hypothetical protein DFQ26_008626 [Actinomortierella ambigua]|nr:hypothetical protein DFQ26_008626 [Actinomortierella ambigua]